MMDRMCAPFTIGLVLGIIGLIHGCTSAPPPRLVYQDPITLVKLQFDRHANGGHTHPVKISHEQMTRVLSGIRVKAREGMIPSVIMGRGDWNPAFSAIEIQTLTPQLTQALELAKPEELATFYRRISDASVGLAVTSGGLFVEGNQLFFILANNRTLPSEALNQNMIYEIDPIDSPLLPINRARTGFKVSFSPSAAIVPPDAHPRWQYIDEGRIVVIDLGGLAREATPPASAAQP
ncbi:MAG: hypothetical protein ACREJU_11765 [Nitrospiraceae bacterium]